MRGIGGMVCILLGGVSDVLLLLIACAVVLRLAWGLTVPRCSRA